MRRKVRRPPPAVRHLLAHRIAFTVVVLTAVIAASFTAAAVSFFSAVTASAATSELQGRPGTAIAVTAAVTPSSVSPISAGIARTIRGLLPGLRPAILRSSQSDLLDAPGGHQSARLQTQLISLPGLAAHIVLVRGQCGSGTAGAGAGQAGAGQAGTGQAGAVQAGAGSPVPACVPVAAARVLGVAPGDLVTLRDPTTHAAVRVRITGIFRRAEPAEPFWMLDPMGASAVQRTHGFTAAGPLVTSPAAIAAAHLAITSVTVIGVPDFGRLTGAALAGLGSRLGIRIGNLNNSTSFHDATVTTSLPGQLSALSTALVVARTKILSGILTLLVIAGATLGIAARLLSQRREAETALLGARGASRTQIARRRLADAAVVAGPAAVAGPLLGILLAPLLADHLTAGLTGAVWLAAAVAAGCVAVIALPWLRRPPSPIRQRASRGRQRSIAAAVYARADLAVIVLGAIVAVGRSRRAVGIVAVDPASYAALAADTPWPGFPAVDLARARTRPEAPVPLLVTPGRAASGRAARTGRAGGQRPQAPARALRR